MDGSGDLFLADRRDNRVRKVSATNGDITTVAGTGTGAYSGDGSAATSATFNFPTGVAVDGVGNLFIADTLNQVIRKVSAADGVITTVAGNRSGTYSGDGTLATNASIFQPSGLALDGAGNLYIADTGNTTSGSTATTTVNVVDMSTALKTSASQNFSAMFITASGATTHAPTVVINVQ